MAKLFSSFSVVAVTIIWCSPAAMAQHEHSDIEFDVMDGQLVTEPRIAESEFGDGLLPAYRFDDPGFDAEGTLPPDSLLGFNVPTITLGADSRSIWYWSGLGDVSFGATPADYNVRVSHPETAESILIDGISSASGFDFAQADDAGGIHSHLVFDLVNAAGDGIDPPASGVYLLATSITGTDLTESDPLYWVAASEVDEEIHEAAVEYVYDTLVVPEPSGLVLAAIASLTTLLVRRRSRRCTLEAK